MPNDPHVPDSSIDELPMVEMLLNVGDSVRIGDRVLRLMDIDGDSSMLRVDLITDGQGSFEDSGWSELPR
ncbi:MAG: hypothetical protein NT013_22150 [Planctomycetia bacterium]|nr:hypothetical protein [Planctomycetia bacterium]